MKSYNTLRWRAVTAASLLVCALAIPGSTAAVPTDATDLDAPAPRRTDTPDAPSLWDRPAAPAPIVVNAAAPTTPQQKSERVQSANPLWAIPLATLGTTRDRPIFSPSRRPPPPAIAPVAAAAPPPPRSKPVKVERPPLALVGTIAGSEQSFGIFVDQSTNTPMRLKIGEEYQGWSLRSVAPREVTLQHDDQTEVLSLPAPDANAAQQMTVQAENSDPITEPRRLRGARR